MTEFLEKLKYLRKKMKKTKKIPNNNLYFKSINKILFFFLILLLPTQLGKHFFIPLSYLSGVRVDYLAPTVYLTDLIVVPLAILIFAPAGDFLLLGDKNCASGRRSIGRHRRSLPTAGIST